MTGTIVGVLRGGPSKEHDVSLKSGHAILNNLDVDRFTTRDIYIDRAGQWHHRGMPVSPPHALRSVDVVIIGLHGEYGEDGEVQKVLERAGVPYTGSDSFASFVAMHKMMAKQKAIEEGVLTPKFKFVEPDGDVEGIVHEVIRTFPMPVVVKPARWGSSVGVSMPTGYAPIYTAVTELLTAGAGGVLIEELIKGREATAGVVEDLRGEALYGLPPVEIVPPDKDFFSYDAKYSGATREICPAPFHKETNDELIRLARQMHTALGLRHYSRSDFIVTPKGIYYLETNTLPGMTDQSLLPKSLAAVGVAFPDFLSHLVGLAMK